MGAKIFRPSTFTIDGLEGIYPGYTEGRHWNGWAMPFFDIGIAMSLMNSYNEGVYDMPKMFYEESSDSFIIPPEDPGDDITIFKGATVRCNDGTHHLYPLGAGCWVWDDESEW